MVVGAYTNRTRNNVFFEGVPWWAERLVIWQSLDQLYTTRTGRPSIYQQLLFDHNQAFGTASVAGRIAQSDTELAQVRLEEQQAYGNRPHKANVWTRYSFTSGRLKGFALGGGWRYQGANVAGVVLSTGRTLWGNPRSIGDLFFQCRTKGLAGLWMEATRVTYQLNIANFLDDRTITATKLDVDAVPASCSPGAPSAKTRAYSPSRYGSNSDRSAPGPARQFARRPASRASRLRVGRICRLAVIGRGTCRSTFRA